MSAHKSLLRTSDSFLLSVLFAAFVLEWSIPTTLGLDVMISGSAGAVLLMCAWALIIIAKHQFKRTGQKTGPKHETNELMTSGIFRYTRNPIYLGVALIAPAIGLLVDSAWSVIAVAPLVWLLQKYLILPEEKYLRERFGDVFSEYCKSVRRWL